MAIKYESALKWGDVFYLKSDPEQAEYSLVGILLLPGKPKLRLRHNGYAKVTVYEAETTRTPDINKKLDIDNKPDDALPPDEEDE